MAAERREVQSAIAAAANRVAAARSRFSLFSTFVFCELPEEPHRADEEFVVNIFPSLFFKKPFAMKCLKTRKDPKDAITYAENIKGFRANREDLGANGVK